MPPLTQRTCLWLCPWRSDTSTHVVAVSKADDICEIAGCWPVVRWLMKGGEGGAEAHVIKSTEGCLGLILALSWLGGGYVDVIEHELPISVCSGFHPALVYHCHGGLGRACLNTKQLWSSLDMLCMSHQHYKAKYNHSYFTGWHRFKLGGCKIYCFAGTKYWGNPWRGVCCTRFVLTCSVLGNQLCSSLKASNPMSRW